MNKPTTTATIVWADGDGTHRTVTAQFNTDLLDAFVAENARSADKR